MNDNPAGAVLLPTGSTRRGRVGSFGLFFRLAWQNLGRRPTRTLLLVLTVAVSSAAAFSAATVRQAVQESLTIGFSRMGADLLLVPRETLVNLTPALLTVEPTPHTLPAELGDAVLRLQGVDQVAPQSYFQIPLRLGAHLHDVDLIAFDPARDFTVLPWLQEKDDHPFGLGDVLLGARREEPLGSQLMLCGKTLSVRGRLGLTGVGPFDRALFVTFSTAETMAAADGPPGDRLACDPLRITALLVRLEVGATPEQLRFAIARMPGVKVVTGTSVFTSARQALTAILGGTLVFSGLILLATVLMVSVLFAAVLAERRRELGLLLAVGTRRHHLVGMILAEAGLATALGGVCGILLGGSLLLAFRRSLGYYFETVHVPFLWPSGPRIALYAALCVFLAAGVGLLGALVPAWSASRREPYDLIRAEGH